MNQCLVNRKTVDVLSGGRAEKDIGADPYVFTCRRGFLRFPPPLAPEIFRPDRPSP
jgi:hypothetical protein